MEQIKYDVFISYSRKDYIDENKAVIPGNVVSKVKDALTAAGITYWFDEEGIYSGDNFTEKIVSNIEISQIFVFLSTENANKSRWTCKEIASADEFGKYIIPVRVDRTPYNRKIMFRIADLSYIDYYQNPEKGINDLIASIKAYLAQIHEEVNRKKVEEEKKREAERRKAEEEKRKREEEEKQRQKQQQELVESIKLTNATINNEESKLQLDRENLLLKAEKVTDNIKREALMQAINTGGAIHLKYQKEQTSLMQKIQDYEKLIGELQLHIKEITKESKEREISTSQIQKELDKARLEIKELQSQLEEKTASSQSQEEEHKNIVESLSQKIETLQKELKEKHENAPKKKGISKKAHIIYILIIIVSSIIWLIIVYDTSRDWEERYKTTKTDLWETKGKITALNKLTQQLSGGSPLIITEIEIKNDGEEWGDSIYSSKSTYFMPKISYFSLKHGNYRLDIKIFNNHGNLSRNSETSPKGYTLTNDIEIPRVNELYTKTLTGWGSSEPGNWQTGTYRIEIWYHGKEIAEKSFHVY